VLFADAELVKKPPVSFFEKYHGTIPSELADVKAQDRNLIDYCYLSYLDLTAIPWSQASTYRDGFAGNIWNYDCFLNGAHMTFSFLGDFEENSMPIFVHISDCAPDIHITDTLITGKTFSQLSKNNELSELSQVDGHYVAYGYAETCALELIFVGETEDSAVLMEVFCTVVE